MHGMAEQMLKNIRIPAPVRMSTRHAAGRRACRGSFMWVDGKHITVVAGIWVVSVQISVLNVGELLLLLVGYM